VHACVVGSKNALGKGSRPEPKSVSWFRFAEVKWFQAGSNALNVGGAHGQQDDAAQHNQYECTLAVVLIRTHPKNVPVRPPYPEFHRSRPLSAAAAEARGLEGQARATGRLPGPPGHPAVIIFSIESLVCCTALASARPHALAPFATAPDLPSDWEISSCADAGLHASNVFLPMHSCFFLPCAHQALESLLRLPTSNMTILPAK